MGHDFFQLVSVDRLRESALAFPVLGKESCPLESIPGRVLAEDFYADCDWPMRSRSCMDGFALRAADSFGAGEFSPAYADIAFECRIDSPPKQDIRPGQCARIVTGGILPSSADSVVMFEQTREMEDGCLEIRRPVAPGENIMLRAEDAAEGDLLLGRGTRVGFRESGLLAAFGGHECRTYRRPRVGIISTGDEIIPVHQKPAPGLVRDVNLYTLAAQVRDCGGEPRLYGAVRDEYFALKDAVLRAIEENDSVLISGGSSVGVRDLTIKVLEDLPDSRILAHGVALSPGKPTILSDISGKAVWGLPGQVSSVQVVMLVLVEPFLRHIGGETDPLRSFEKRLYPAVLGRNTPSAPGREDYVRISMETGEGESVAWPVTGKSGLLRTMSNAWGMIRIPAESEGLVKGEKVRVLPFRVV